MSSQNPRPTEYLTTLRERIVTRFNREELRLLTFDLDVNYDDLRGETISSKIQALLEYLQQHDRLPDLLSQLQQQRPAESWPNYLPAEPEAVSPYKGLRFFDEADAPLFFGREQLAAELVDHLHQHRFLAVVGASGSGKSSVVRAGVIPAVCSGAIVDDNDSSASWPIHVITPGDEPLKALAVSLTRHSESVTAAQTLLADLRASSDSLDLFLYRAVSNGRFLLVVDQFEELFTQCNDATARQLFVDGLVTAVTSGQQGRLSLILTLRADFYAFAVQLESLRPLLETRQRIVGAMSQAELCQAIEGPAAKEKWQLQPGLAETILQDVGREPGALPLLSHALQETWARREGRTLTLAGYQAAGGVRKAIAQTANAVYAGLTPEQRTIARNIFLRLTELGEGTEDTRRRTALVELLPQGEGETAVKAVLDLLARRRLVTLSEETAQSYAEVAHEALIREWPALRAWLDENREGLRLHRQLTEAARTWQTASEEASYLYRGGRLAQAREWLAQPAAQLSELEQQFVTASLTAEAQAAAEREAQRQRELEQAQQLAEAQIRRAAVIRRALGIILLLLVLAVGAAAFGFRQSSIAVENADLAAARAVEASNAQATAEFAQATAEFNARLLATREAEAVNQAQIAQSQAFASASLAVQSQDPMRGLLLAIAAGQAYHTALAYNALHSALPRVALPVHTLQHDSDVAGLVWNQDESLILTWSADGTARVWDAASGVERLRLSHDDSVIGAAWNGDEDLILAWSADSRAQVWDAASGAERLRLSHDDSVIGATWNRDEDLILTSNADGTARVWDAASGAERLRLSHDDSVSGASWNRDESLILTWSTDGTARVWDVVSGAERLRLSHDDSVMGVAWNGNEDLILTWNADGTARIWDAASGAERLRFSHDGSVSGAAWNSDEDLILTWSTDSTARIWHAASGAERLRLSHDDSVTGAAWNRDEDLILTSSADGTVRVWDADAVSGAERPRLSHDGSVDGAAWNRDENLILTWSTDGSARVWNAVSGAERLRLDHDDSVIGAAWNGDEGLILTWSTDGTARVWDAVGGAGRPRFSHDGSVSGAAWNGDEDLILTWSTDGTTRVWDAASGVERLRLSHGDPVSSAAWNRDESLILTSGADGTARVWDATSGAGRLLLNHDGSVTGAAWNRDEDLILTWGVDGTARFWDVISDAEPLRLSFADRVRSAEWQRLSYNDSVTGAAWNRDESLILTWSGDDTARISATVWAGLEGDWDSPEEQLRLNHDDSVTGATWNGDESLILTWSADGTARVWYAVSGMRRQRLSHDDSVTGAVWNGDESLILTWSTDGVARFWDAVRGTPLFTLIGDGTSVVAAQWSQDERRILLVTRGGFAGGFYIEIADLLESACQRTVRNMTWQEWHFYFPGQPYRIICDQWPVHPSVPPEQR